MDVDNVASVVLPLFMSFNCELGAAPAMFSPAALSTFPHFLLLALITFEACIVIMLPLSFVCNWQLPSDSYFFIWDLRVLFTLIPWYSIFSIPFKRRASSCRIKFDRHDSTSWRQRVQGCPNCCHQDRNCRGRQKGNRSAILSGTTGSAVSEYVCSSGCELG